jgi:hypothetical protein
VPISYEGLTLGIEPGRNWFIYTHVAPSYVGNSLRLQKLDLAVEDNREEALQTVAAIATGTAKLSTGVGAASRGSELPAPLTLPVVIDLADAKNAVDQDKPLPLNPGWHYRISWLDHGPEEAGFIRREGYKDVHGAAITSLCRPLQITLLNAETKLVMGVTVADPDYLETIPLPPSGTVTFHDLCGADVAMQKAVTVPTNTLANDFFNAVLDVRAATKTAPRQH